MRALIAEHREIGIWCIAAAKSAAIRLGLRHDLYPKTMLDLVHVSILQNTIISDCRFTTTSSLDYS